MERETTVTDAKAKTSKVTQSKAAKKQTIAQILAKKKAVTKQVPIQTDGEVANEILTLRRLHSAARDADRLSNDTDKAPSIQEKIDTLVAASQDSIVVFTFKSIGRENYDDLILEHPPTKKQKEEGSDFNTDTFPPILVAASCVEPEMTVEEANQMFASDSWNGAELRDLFFGALGVNTETGDIPLSRSGSDGTLSSLLSLVSASNTQSPTQSM